MTITTQRGSRLYRLLTVTLTTTDNVVRAENSRFQWGLHDGRYRLRIIGVLPKWIKVWVEEPI
jgi:hypothetical protein